MQHGLVLTRNLMASKPLDKSNSLSGASSDKPRRSNSAPNRRRSWAPLLPNAQHEAEKDVESQLCLDEATEQRLPVSGPVALLGVAFLWGTYSPTLRGLYSLPHPPDPAALTAARSLIQAGSLWVTSLWIGTNSPQGDAKDKQQQPGQSALRAGLEMGFWNFLATSLQANGLEHTTAVRGAFIIQATAILTPLLASLAGESPGRNVWIGCAIALGSTLLITVDSTHASRLSNDASFISIGDAAVFGAAFFYSVTTVRLSFYARQLPAIKLASAKSNALAAWAFLWLVVLMLQRAGTGGSTSELWEAASQPTAWLLVLWSALGPGALAAFLQSQGQSNVASSQAQVYYSSTPIWSVLLAMLLLHGETMGPRGWLGGAGIIFAGFLSSR